MKKLIPTFLSLLFLFFVATAQAQTSTQPDKNKPLMVVEASCGQCQLGLKGEGCALAIRLNGKSYFVDGTSIDEHGDAHANDGFCNAIRKARVQGVVKNNRFKATYFQLLPEPPKDKPLQE